MNVKEVEKSLNCILKDRIKNKIKTKTALKRCEDLKQDILKNNKKYFRNKCKYVTQYIKIIKNL